ncbi:MAG: hypothetical protein HY814_03060 [Candidatus Riflebacteria bacterium]|nr:hypothetical protein [Candidatus Riflebacteria bacterium]
MNLQPRLRSLLIFALLLAALVPGTVQAYLLQTRDIVFLVRTGTNQDGTPAFRVATSNDYGANRVYQLASSSDALERTAAYYRYIQEQRNQAILAQAGQYGLSASDQQMARSLLQSDPIYIELKEGNGGTFNDWKGTFTVRDSNGGYSTRVQSPRVTLPVGSSVVTGGDSALLEQTLVHEVGHSMMSKGYGIQNLPDSPYLSQAHSGGSVTDQQLALIEGYAEFIGSYFTNRLTIANDARNSISNNLYAYSSSGAPKSANDLMRTEGWVATTLWTLATRSGIQNFLGKLATVMAQGKPQSFGQLLEYFQRMYPSDAKALRATVARTSNGVIYADGYGAGSGGSGNAGSTASLCSQYETSLQRYVQLRSAYLSTDNYYYQYERWRLGQAAQQEASRLQSIETQLRRQVQSGGGSGDAMLRLVQSQRSLQSYYNQLKQQLNGMPWYARRERSQLEAEAQAVGEALQREARLVQNLETNPVYYRASNVSRAYAPAAPTNSKDAYRNLLDVLKTGDRDRAAEALEAYQSTGQPKVPANR